MYEPFFNLTMKPFDLLPNPDFLFLSKSHRKALMYLDYGIRERAGFVLLTGGIGSGKTTVIRDLIKKKDSRTVLSRIFNTRVNSEQLLAMINDDFGLSGRGKDKVSLLRELNDFLIAQFAKGSKPVLIIDEAQNLSADLLEEVRMLSNLETDQAKLLQIILVGQPELRITLASPALVQLRQRISVNCAIHPLTRQETELYILHRLERAGNRNAAIFSQEALEMIFTYSRGIPRLINIICDFLMLAAFAEETRRIDGEMVKDITGDLDFENHFWGDETPKAAGESGGDSIAFQRSYRVDADIPSRTREECTGLRAEGRFSPQAGEGGGVGALDHCGKEGRAVKEGVLRRMFGASGMKILATLCFLFLGGRAGAAEFELHPSLAVSEEYTDNVFETRDNEVGDYITRLLPGAAIRYNASFWDWDARYTFDYRYYARSTRDHDTTHVLGANGLVRIVDEFMLLELKDDYRRVSLDVSRDTSQESMFVNQSDRNTFTASPYFRWRLGSLSTLKTGYRYVNTWYREPGGVDKRDHGSFAELSHVFSLKTSITAGYAFNHRDTAISDADRHDAYAGGRYEYAEKSFFLPRGVTPGSDIPTASVIPVFYGGRG